MILALVAPGAPAATGRFVDYLYVDSNEGGSSGGHTALRLGDVVYHYQYERPGVLHLEGEPADEFDARDRLLENRTIRLSRVPVDDDTNGRVPRLLGRHGGAHAGDILGERVGANAQAPLSLVLIAEVAHPQ